MVRISGVNLSSDTNVVGFNDSTGAPLVVIDDGSGGVTVTLPATGVATTLPASATAAQLAAALVAAFPTVFTQGT